MKKYDLEYLEQGLFTAFFPLTREGEMVWAELDPEHGTGKIFTIQLKITLFNLRKAGYNVRKAKKPAPLKPGEADEMLKELGLE